MRRRLLALLLLPACAGPALDTPAPEPDQPAAAEERAGPTLEVSAFTVVHATSTTVAPEAAYDAFTGDITAWWDHSFASGPASLVIEPFPGGRFVETFREGSPDGALHATVTRAERGRVLAFRGPLGFGLTGMHFDMVHTLTFEPEGTGTRLTMTVQGLGTIQPGWEDAVQGVWAHFLDARFVPFAEGRLGDG